MLDTKPGEIKALFQADPGNRPCPRELKEQMPAAAAGLLV
jgi:hypothetical protein